MPIPVSRTTNRNRPFGSRDTSTSTVPAGVNFSALPIRFVSTWRRRAGSPQTQSGTPSPQVRLSSVSRLPAVNRNRSTISPRAPLRSKGARSSARVPASIREKSRMSSINRNSEVAELWISSA